MAIFYHGSSVLFDRFDLSHALEGDGKVKFGFGVYVTERYVTAAHYAYNKKRGESEHYYVYTCQVPDLTDENIFPLIPEQHIHPAILSRIEQKLGYKIPEDAFYEVKKDSKTKEVNRIYSPKCLRKYLANILAGHTDWSIKKLTSKTTIEAEKLASEFLDSIGVDCYVWPVIWKKPDEEHNLAILNDQKVKLLKIEEVKLDEEYQLIAGSQHTIFQLQ